MQILFLTCADSTEAERITQNLLENKLISCAKMFPIKSKFLWKGNIENSDEILITMESEESKFSDVEKAVKTLHSYEQFVLTAIPVSNASQGVKDWIKSETQS